MGWGMGDGDGGERASVGADSGYELPALDGIAATEKQAIASAFA